MNAKGWYSTKTLVNTRANNAGATVVHRPGRFVDSQPDVDGDSGGCSAAVSTPSKESPFTLVPLRKRPFPRSPTEPTSPRKRTHAAQDAPSVGGVEARARDPLSSGDSLARVYGSDRRDRAGHVTSDDDSDGDKDVGDGDIDASDQSAGDSQERGHRERTLICDDKLDSCDDERDDDGGGGDFYANDSQQDQRDSPDRDDNDGIMDFDDRDNDADNVDDDAEPIKGGHDRARHSDNRRTMLWNDDDSSSSSSDMPTAAEWKRSPAAATAACLRAEERRLRMLCKVHEAVLRQTEAALDGVRFAIRRLERMRDQGA